MRKVFFIIFIVLIIGALGYGGWFIYKSKNTLIEKFNPQSLPATSETGKVNLPGILIGPKATERATSLAPERIIYWTNQYRTENGLPQLSQNVLLGQAATKKIEDMSQKQYFNHVSPTGQTPSDLVLSTGYNYKVTGENLALGDFQDEKELVDAWMKSPGHRANILNPDYEEIGVATGLNNFQDKGFVWLAVQEFGKPAPNCQAPNQGLNNQIELDKQTYENLSSKISDLYNQANNQIQTGNNIYQETHKSAEAQPYWDQGTSLQNQAKQFELQLENLYSQINSEINQFNQQVNSYNQCIEK